MRILTIVFLLICVFIRFNETESKPTTINRKPSVCTKHLKGGEAYDLINFVCYRTRPTINRGIKWCTNNYIGESVKHYYKCRINDDTPLEQIDRKCIDRCFALAYKRLQQLLSSRSKRVSDSFFVTIL